MKTLKFKQVDVFTSRPFLGNPVAVVLEGAGMSAADMQRVAAWTNLSETTFVLPPTSAAADYRLRIFTPRAELPFAGHPTIGSAHAVLEAGIVKARGGRLRQECGAGNLDLQVDGETIWLSSPPATDTPIGQPEISRLEQALGGRVSGKPRIINVGPRWLIAELDDVAAVAALKPDMQVLTEMSVALAIGGVTVFGASEDKLSAMHVRSFAPAHGIAEDPVCGSGNISVAAYVATSGRADRFGAGYTARQGMQLGRDGRVSIRFDGGKILLGGSAVTCIEGTLRLE
ncbi:MAG TPA: PhzF family phenazine biosynthesis protein [Burkholderiales bacterium]|nr:PhzF family phenazine biosynthesis protein [Burkholderiales bacterium]